MIVIPVIQVLCFGLYIWYIVHNYGVITSISESWYANSKRNYMFILFIWSIGIPTLFLSQYSSWFFASGAFLMFVSAASAFKSEDKWVGIIHSTDTVGGIAFACFALCLHGLFLPVILCTITSVLFARLKIKNTTWWTEVACFSAIEIGVVQLILAS